MRKLMLLLFLVGCGSSGGGGGTEFPGVYEGTLFLTSNDCKDTAADNINGQWIVNQDQEHVVVNEVAEGSAGYNFSGLVVDEQTFEVSQQDVTDDIGYFRKLIFVIDGEEADVTRTQHLTNDFSECERTWKGLLVKTN